MNLKNIKNLLYLNLIYTIVPATLDKLRKKNKNKSVNVQGAIIRQHLILSVTYLIIFGVGALMLKGDEDRFLLFVSTFSIFAVLQGVLSAFNVFYESSDMQAYIPLPFSNLEIFTAKIISCFLSIVYFIAPILFYCIFIQFNFAHPIYQSIFLGILSSIIIASAIMFTSIILTYALTKLPAFKKHKKVAVSVMTALVMLGTILMLVTINSSVMYGNDAGNTSSLILKISLSFGFTKVFWIFFGLAENPFSFKVLIHLLAWMLFIAIEVLICLKTVIPNICADATSMQTLISSAKKKKLITKGSSLESSLLHYHLGFLLDTQVLISYLLMPPLMIAISLFPTVAILKREFSSDYISYNYMLVCVVTGIFYSLISNGMLSLIIISLDKENYNFIKSLPFDMKRYIRYKFWFSYIIQQAVPQICMIVLSVFIKLPLFLALSAMITYAITALPLCAKSIKKDHENLLLDWTNVIQLSYRGGYRAAIIGKFFGVLIFGVIAVIISVSIAEKSSFTVIICLITVIYVCILAYAVFCVKKAKKYFNDNL
ncbi:MAG: hypothetical protein ACTTH0_03075 [Eubacteriales bacterium]